MDTWKNPYKDMNFDASTFDKEITKTRESFDATIQDAGMQAGMASGQSGMNVSRVTADTYARAMGQRDATVAGLEGQKAQAKAQFDTQKQQAIAQAEAEYQKSKPGFMDWLSGGVSLVTGIATMNPWGILGGSTKMIGNLAGGMAKPNIKPLTQSKATPNSGMTTTDFTATTQDAINSFNFSANTGFGNIKRKKSNFNFDNPNYNWGFK